MPKNIVVCCDGTNEQFDAQNTNVVRLFSLLVHDEDQVAFYDPGLGSLNPPGVFAAVSRALPRGMALAFGYGLAERIGDAYRHLMNS